MSVSGRAAARAIWEAALAAGNVDPIVRRVLRLDGDVITAGPLAVDLKTVRRLLVLGAGKASAAMAQAVEDLLANPISDGLFAAKDGHAPATRPVPVLTLALSDVIGNAMDVIASGPTAPDPSTYAQALEIIDRFKLRERALLRIVGRLEAGARGAIPETPKPGDPLFARVTNLVIGDNSLVVDAAAARAAA